MNEEEFNSEINRLISQFGKAAYSPERCKLIWQEVRQIPGQRFRFWVNDWIGSLRQAPLLPEIREVIARDREKLQAQQQSKQIDHWDKPAHCSHCRDNGVHIALHKDFIGPYAFRCHCWKGEADPRKNIPQFKQWHIDQGYYWVDVNRYKAGECGKSSSI